MVKEIPLTRGKVALVDDDDFEELSRFKWRAARVRLKHHGDQWYAVRSLLGARSRSVRMHRQILKADRGVDVDHRDGDGLNNQRSNLRVANTSQNNASRTRLNPSKSSRFRGVWFNKCRGYWEAEITVTQKKRHLGVFAREEDAAEAYNHAAVKAFGEFARLNDTRLPQPDPTPAGPAAAKRAA